MEKKSSINDVHKVVQKDLVELHKTLSKKLGDYNPFAKFSIGGGFYVWTDSRRKWTQMCSASDLEQSFVRAALFDTKQRISAILGEKTADLLFTTPDDSYIYFSNEGENIEILLTGWAFKKPTRVRGQGDVDEIKRDNPVGISFIYDNQVLCNYEFGIQLPKQIKHLITNYEGVYQFANLKVNEKFAIVDFPTNQHFQLVVVEGQEQYNFDVTVYSRLDISATLGAAPLEGENINVVYHGKSYDVTTGPDGLASLKLPYFENTDIAATVRDMTQHENVNCEGNHMHFHFEPPQVLTDVEVSVVIDGQPALEHEVEIHYGEDVFEGKTNAEGKYSCQVGLKDGAPCSVSVPGFNPQTKLLTSEKNIFLFEKTSEEVPPVLFNPHIKIECEDGSIAGNYSIQVLYDSNMKDYTSDEEGIVPLPQMEEGKIMKVFDGLNPENSCEYELDSNQLEYIFRVPNQNRKIKVTILDEHEKPFVCDQVNFKQESPSSELTVSLDSNGSTFFEEDTFATNKDLTVSILGSKKKYDPIVFTLDEGEYEYILQEKNSRSSWRMILLQILAVIAILAFALLLWPFIKALSMILFDIIYN